MLVILGLASVIIFVLSLITLPWLLAKIPLDYFQRPPGDVSWQMLLKPQNLLRNLLGIPIVIAGIAMLVLPGQGLLTIFLGLAIMNYPGKYTLERKLIARPGVLKAVNWLRQKTNTPPLSM